MGRPPHGNEALPRQGWSVKGTDKSLTQELRLTYKPWLVAATDDSRPVLNTIMVRKDGLAVAANGFAMVVIPVDLSPDDVVPCNVPREAWQMAAGVYTGTSKLSIKLCGDHVKLDNGCTWRTMEGAQPSLEKIIPDSAPAPIDRITFNPKLLAAVYGALGKSALGMRCVFRGENKPIWIGYSEAPYGLLMPMHGSRS